MRPRQSRPCSAAKQGRSFRVTPINSAPTRFSGSHILVKGSPPPPAQSKMRILRKEFDVAKSGLDFRIPKWTAWAGRARPRHLGARILRSEMDPRVLVFAQSGWGRFLQRRSFLVPPINPPEACVPKTVKATFCSKTAILFVRLQ